MRRHVVTALTLVAVVAACGSSDRAPNAPNSGACEVANSGSLIGINWENARAQTPAGGPIADGVYDLTRWSSFKEGKTGEIMAPSLRWTMRIHTDERSSNHAEGTIAHAIEDAPKVGCCTGRFAITGNDIVIDFPCDAKHRFDRGPYSAGPDSLTLLDASGTIAMVFKRRP